MYCYEKGELTLNTYCYTNYFEYPSIITYHINFIMTITHTAHNTTRLHFIHVFSNNNVFITSSCDYNIHLTNYFVKLNNFKSIHTETI